jgi:hypothetical protein
MPQKYRIQYQQDSMSPYALQRSTPQGWSTIAFFFTLQEANAAKSLYENR